jgi:alpha-tubulin suppressor-like RCC1 family protein
LIPGLMHVSQIVVARGLSCARLDDGHAKCWGRNDLGQLGDGTSDGRKVPMLIPGLDEVREVAAASTHVCALRNDGSVQCWGANASGELGDRTTGARAIRGDVLW